MENQIKCSHCDETFDSSEVTMTLTVEGPICENCIDNYGECEETGELHLFENLVTSFKIQNNGTIELLVKTDHHCYVLTDSGENWHFDDVKEVRRSPRRNSGTYYISQDDYENGSYYTCNDCEDIFHGDYIQFIQDGDIPICESCITDYNYCESCEDYSSESCGCEESCDTIHNYSYKPNPKFKGVIANNNPYIGFELELECKFSRIDDSELVSNFFSEDDIYLKEDGSLSDGFEIVSHPMTIEEHKKNDYSKLLKALSKNGCTSHDTKTCGLHFHLDKTKMTDGHKVRLGAFIAINQAKVEKIARRSSERWASFKKIDNKLGTKALRDKKLGLSESRYEALNWTNSNTVEFRVFKGTLKYETFMASMEFCQASYAFTLNTKSIGTKIDSEIVWARFNKFIDKNKNDYSFLIKYLASKGIGQVDSGIELIDDSDESDESENEVA